ncbi:hypothetical protein [Bacillus massiliigorillae]|uniref:hypothetical protein n=1 Tax=Bacillus massiliigorillae TaxID=1243664 RepID=UPI0005A8BA8B|nr:hypothetical protein [Bacillus massiliigorillae]
MFQGAQTLKLLELKKDTIGRYMKLDIPLSDGTITIRWNLDAYTYQQIRAIVSKKHLDSLAIDYHYEIIPYISSNQNAPNSTPTRYGSIRCIQDTQGKNILFSCSDLFAGNMEWFRRYVSSTRDIAHLRWENFI